MTNRPAHPGTPSRRLATRRRRALAAAAAMVLSAAPAAPAQLVPTEMPAPARGLETQDKRGEQVPLSLNFLNSDGSAVRLGDFFNRPVLDERSQPLPGKGHKPVVLMFNYYRCPVMCPAVLDKLTGALNQIEFTVGQEFDVLVVSFDERDKPADAAVHKATALLAYNRTISEATRQGWTFLTGHTGQSKPLADSVGFAYRFLPESGEFSHGAGIFVLTPEGKLSRYLTPVEYPDPGDVRLAIVEASNGKIGTIFDSFTLWCYHWDAAAGTYTLQAMRLMQAGGLLTLALLGGLLGVFWRRERSARRLAAVSAVRGDRRGAVGSARLQMTTGQTP